MKLNIEHVRYFVTLTVAAAMLHAFAPPVTLANPILVGQGELTIRIVLDFDPFGVPTLDFTIRTHHVLDGTTGPVDVLGVIFNFDSVSPLNGMGRGRFDVATGTASGDVTIHDAVGTEYHVMVAPSEPPVTPGIVGMPLQSRHGGPFSFPCHVESLTPSGQGTETAPFFGVAKHLVCANTNVNLDALIAATDPLDPNTYFDVTTPGAFLDLLPGGVLNPTAQVFDPNGVALGRFVGNEHTHHFQFFAWPVPEPSTLTLFGLGILGLLGYGWRRGKLKA